MPLWDALLKHPDGIGETVVSIILARERSFRQSTMSVMVAAPEALSKLNELEVSLNTSIRGKPEVVRLAIVCLLARGHILIEDVPGVGKTTLAQALARAVHGRFHRLQFTSAMLPSDVLGVTINNANT